MRQTVSTRMGLLIGLAGASAVLLGAFGAHALRGVLDAQSRELWQTAVNYHVWHALALVLAAGFGRGRSGRFAIAAFALGIVLFSGSLFALAADGARWLGWVTPVGGAALICGWLALATLALRRR